MPLPHENVVRELKQAGHISDFNGPQAFGNGRVTYIVTSRLPLAQLMEKFRDAGFQHGISAYQPNGPAMDLIDGDIHNPSHVQVSLFERISCLHRVLPRASAENIYALHFSHDFVFNEPA